MTRTNTQEKAIQAQCLVQITKCTIIPVLSIRYFAAASHLLQIHRGIKPHQSPSNHPFNKQGPIPNLMDSSSLWVG